MYRIILTIITMKTLENHILVYDRDCPLCTLYSGAFVNAKMLDTKGRIPYTELTTPLRKLIDLNRSRNEIALVNVLENKVIYGLDSLLTIVSYNFPFMKKIAQLKPLYWFLKKLYAVISFNRKVIAATSKTTLEGACIPDYNRNYRWIFIVLCSIFVGWVLNLYVRNITCLNPLAPSFFMEGFITVGQLVFQGLFVFFSKKEKVLDYLGHNMVVSVIGALVLLPAIWCSEFLIDCSPLLYIGYLVLPISIMLWQHIRRVKLLGLNSGLTISWLLYRAFIIVIYFVVV